MQTISTELALTSEPYDLFSRSEIETILLRAVDWLQHAFGDRRDPLVSDNGRVRRWLVGKRSDRLFINISSATVHKHSHALAVIRVMNSVSTILLGNRQLMQLLVHTKGLSLCLSTLLGCLCRTNLGVGGACQFTQLKLSDRKVSGSPPSPSGGWIHAGSHSICKQT